MTIGHAIAATVGETIDGPVSIGSMAIWKLVPPIGEVVGVHAVGPVLKNIQVLKHVFLG